MKRLVVCILLMSIATAIHAEDKDITPPPSPVTGTFDMTSNYIFRGITQTKNLPAMQGSFTYTTPKYGAYFSLWGSNVKQTAIDGSIATLELDPSIGVANTIGEHFDYNVSLVRYSYPQATALSYIEMLANLNYYFVTALLGYSGNESNTHASGNYINLGVKFSLPERYVYFKEVTLAANVGHSTLPRAAGHSYNDYNIIIDKKINSTFDMSLALVDTNHRYSNNSFDQAHVVATVNAVFP